MKTRFVIAALAALATLGASGLMAGNAENAAKTAKPARTATAIFAGGCFWCTESDFEKLPGVISAESGYTGGKTANPTYQEVSSGVTGHTEAVRVVYDPARVSYPELLTHLWRNIDPTVKDSQFCDHGSQYRSGIYYQNEEEHRTAEESRDALLKSGKFTRIYTEILAAGTFYPAEEYHQDYYKKNPVRYNFYRRGCGRDYRLRQLWGAP